MRPFAVWGLVGCGAAGLAGPAAAQAPPPQPYNFTAPQPAMPGTPVGVGTRLPTVGTRVGGPPGGVPGALDPSTPKPPGQPIDLKNVVTPYPGMPGPEPTFWQKLEAKWFKMFEPDPLPPRVPNWTPGIARRNRERARMRQWVWWLRD